ncbi:gamma-glutamyl hydrolase 1 isoform X1 [Eutrema salsugineum]|uniref:gamma-glutamyl hydrolase 1 isoform X1 n=1 Tax=Eutrema salsugineum TaxID=72664 RepID=UPI000CECF495|nr:gamma-glutamyl hydrolase 1 isoform X1 [Eutrema salsugineum]
MWRYCFCLPLLLFDIGVAKASDSSASIFLPSQTGVDGSRSPVCSSPDPNLNYRPVIGILSHPGDGASGRLTNDTSSTYIAASYVKFAEAGGARVIPLIYNEPERLLFQKLELVNGVIFTGGWAKKYQYFDIVKKIFNVLFGFVLPGTFSVYNTIPIFFMLLHRKLWREMMLESIFQYMAFASDSSLCQLSLVRTETFLKDLMQKIMHQVSSSLKMLISKELYSKELLKKLSTDCLVMQKHKYGITPANFRGNPALSSFFEIITTCVDENSKTYVSTVKAKRYPITGFQWHPEKNAFEWGSSQIPHSEDAIQVTQHAASYLVSEARKSKNRPESKKVLSNLIYNYKPTYCGYAGRGYDEVYLFTQPRARF